MRRGGGEEGRRWRRGGGGGREEWMREEVEEGKSGGGEEGKRGGGERAWRRGGGDEWKRCRGEEGRRGRGECMEKGRRALFKDHYMERPSLLVCIVTISPPPSNVKTEIGKCPVHDGGNELSPGNKQVIHHHQFSSHVGRRHLGNVHGN